MVTPGETTVYSFDVFDTCLTRPFARATDLYFGLMQQLLKQQGLPGADEIVFEMVRHRLQGEHQARQQLTEREDINIYQIYQHLHFENWGMANETVVAAETQYEAQMARPILATQRRIQHLRQTNQKIIFISDMYLPTSLIRQMLIHHGFASKADAVYVSGDIGLTKATGHLFQHVLTTEGLSPEQLCHYGDNLYTDIYQAKQQGIPADHCHPINLTRYEATPLQQSFASPLISSQISGISRVTRLKYAETREEAKGHSQLVANVIAPLLTSYVAWVLQQAQKQQIERLYFVSRDGEILLKIAQAFAPHLPLPECRYLYGSRQAWFLPTLTRGDRQQLDWLILPEQSCSVIALLKKLSLSPKDISTQLTHYGFHGDRLTQQLEPDAIERFWQLLETPEIRELILVKAREKRTLALRYFAQEGLLDASKKWALVDIGWTLKCQRALQTLLQSKNPALNVRGYYLGLLRTCLNTNQAGHYQGFVLQDMTPQPLARKVDWLFRYLNLIDQGFTAATHPSVSGYAIADRDPQQIVPIFKATSVSQTYQDWVQSLHQLVPDYAQEIAQTKILTHHLNELRYWALSNFVTCLADPTPAEVQAIAQLHTSDDQLESRQRPVARPIQLRELFYFAGRLLRRPAREYGEGFEWLEGSVALSPWLVQWCFKLYRATKNYAFQHQLQWIYLLWFKLKNI